jgi:hypothetical protein
MMSFCNVFAQYVRFNSSYMSILLLSHIYQIYSQTITRTYILTHTYYALINDQFFMNYFVKFYYVILECINDVSLLLGSLFVYLKWLI